MNVSVVCLPGELDAPASIVLDSSVVILPGNTEADDAFRFCQSQKGSFVKGAVAGILKERQ